MPRCFVPGCKSGYDSVQSASEKRHFFKPPRDAERLALWQRAVPRLDRELSSTCSVCDLHFRDEDISKVFEHNICGEVVAIPRDKWALKDDAVPRLFPNCPSYLSKPTRKRKAPARRLSPAKSKRRKGKGEQSIQEVSDGNVETENSVSTDNTEPLFDMITSLAKEKQKIDGWSVDVAQQTALLYKLSIRNNIPRVETSVALSEDLNLTVCSNGRLVPRSVYAGEPSIALKSFDDLKCFMHYVDKLKLCQGCPAEKYPKIVSSVVATKEGETWRRNTCTVLSFNATCAQCRTLEKLFLQRTKKQKDCKKRKQRVCLKSMRRKAIRATSRREKMKEELVLMKRQLSGVTEATIDSTLRVLPSRQQLAFKTAVMAAKAKSKNGRRYDAEWLMTCLLLHISSPKAYTLIADMQLLPLPSKARLRQIIKGIPCKYGFNEVALSSIKGHFSDKSHLRRQGVLLLDEVKLKQGVSFNKASCKMDGFVDYGEVAAPSSNQLADHALVLMFVPLFEDWVQPVASFATRGAAPGKVLAELVMSAVLELHKNNASVLAVISDGAGNNKSMWSQFGVSGKLDAPHHFIEHPWEPSQNIYFLCDVPHIVKCVRNHLRKHTYGMAGDLRINFQHYVTLYETEKNKHVRVVPKLTEAHVAPDNLRKMSVRLATQLFSRGTAIGLRVYREAKVTGLEDSEDTETFTRMLNDVFDALNTKLPSRGIRRNSKEIQIIKEFLDVLNLTERNAVEKGTKLFASQQTTESLRVTLLSTLDIISYLFDKEAVYVLTAKLNQDPLERHFGLARSFGGDESHPTVVNFSQIFRLLSLYTPIKTALRGSVQGEPNAVLVSVEDTLKTAGEAHRSNRASLRNEIEARLLEVTSFPCIPPDQMSDEHSYFRGSPDDSVVYYLAGYVVHKMSKRKECQLCLHDISSAAPVIGSDAYLTIYRSFKEGSLRHPSVKMLHFMRVVNESISLSLDEEGLCADLFWKVLDELDECDLTTLGCDQHKPTFTCEVLYFFIVTRMHFYARDVNRRLQTREKVAIATKKARLL